MQRFITNYLKKTNKKQTKKQNKPLTLPDNVVLTNHVKHEVPYQEAQCHTTAKYESSR